MAGVSIQDKQKAPGGTATGFDYLRVSLAFGVLMWHSWYNVTGVSDWDFPLRFLPAAKVPAFFALSGFLVTASLERNNLRSFLTLRAVRIFPPLILVTVVSACAIGLLFTTLRVSDYLVSKQFYAYFLNIIGVIHYTLPGVFANNIAPSIINEQLWTIPYELQCYLTLVVLSVFKILDDRFLVFLSVLGLGGLGTLYQLHHANINTHAPSHSLIVFFLAGVSLYRYRNVVPYSNRLAIIAFILGAICLEFPVLNYLAGFPVAYLTVWLGLKRPPPIIFGDLSYGIYLFHYPIEQTVMHLFPAIDKWWVLSLICVPLVVAAAILSKTFVEQPILSRKKQIISMVDRGYDASRSAIAEMPWWRWAMRAATMTRRATGAVFDRQGWSFSHLWQRDALMKVEVHVNRIFSALFARIL